MANAKRVDQVILGLLCHEPLTGYDIKKRMDTGLRMFWNASFGSIYPSLNLLEKEEKVTKIQIKENGRDKIVYTITDKGRESLKQWLKEPVIKDELRYETLLKLFFGNEVGPEVTLEHINAFENKIKNELPFLEILIQNLSGVQKEETHKYYLSTALFGKKIYETYLEWCEETKEMLINDINNHMDK